MSEPAWGLLTIGDAHIRTATWGSGPVDIVLLHDGLGSIPQWRDLPSLIAERSGSTVTAYERSGHGASTPAPTGPWPTDWLHREAEIFALVLDALDCDAPDIVGHSDGASIALIHAAERPDRVARLVSLAAHSWVEPVCSAAIGVMRSDRAPIVSGLSKHHDHPEAIFEAWSGVWVSEQFSHWDIRGDLSGIDAPTLVAQGTADAYASDAMAELTAVAIGANARCELVKGVGHILHHEQPGTVADLVARFLK